MTTVVLDEKSARIPLGEMLRSATDAVIEIRSTSGGLVAKVLLAQEPIEAEYRPIVAAAEAEINELRRRRNRGRGGDVTTPQLLERLQSLKPE